MTGHGDLDGPDDAVVTECELDAPPETVWRALTVREMVAAWLLPNTLDPAVGSTFSFAGKAAGLSERIDCTVLAAEPNRLLRYSWQESRGDGEDGRGPASAVTFHLAGTAAGGTHLRIVHSGLAGTRRTGEPAPAANCNRPGGLRCAA